jgi:FkbM family methyltransferase
MSIKWLIEKIQSLLSVIGVAVISKAHLDLLEKSSNPKVTDLLERFSVQVLSVLHIGGHYAEEAEEYMHAGITKATFIEGDPEIYALMMKKLEKYENYSGKCALLSDKTEVTKLYIASNDGASSSILQPGRVLQERPDINFQNSIELESETLDSMNLGKFDLVVLDVQGAESKVLSGGMQIVNSAKALWIEVNIGNMYAGDADVQEIISSLSDNFIPVYISMNTNLWGDALLLNKTLLKNA